MNLTDLAARLDAQLRRERPELYRAPPAAAVDIRSPWVSGPHTPIFRTLFRRSNETRVYPNDPYQFETYDHQTLAEHMQAFAQTYPGAEIVRITSGMVRNRQGIHLDLPH